MRGQAQWRDAWVIDEPARDHVPAERALEGAEDEDREKRNAVARRDSLPDEKPQIRQQERHTNRPTEQAMEIFPPENLFERIEAHAAVDLQVFGCRLILLERDPPMFVADRRQRADDGLPLRDREPRMGQARYAADDDHRQEQRAADEEPDRHGTGIGGRRALYVNRDRCAFVSGPVGEAIAGLHAAILPYPHRRSAVLARLW